MTARRAAYGPGTGLLFVANDRLLFLETAGHAAQQALVAAASSDRPLRSLAAAVIDAEFAVPPFVFLEQRRDLRGMVVGSIRLAVADRETSVIDGDTGDPWSQIHGSGTAVASVGGDVGGHLWIDSGMALADTFRWDPAPAAEPASSPEPDTEPASSPAATAPPAERATSGTAPGAPRPATGPRSTEIVSAPTPPAAGDLEPATGREPESLEADLPPLSDPAPVGASLAEILDAETDLTIDAIRLAEVRGGLDTESSGHTSAPVRSTAPEAPPTQSPPSGRALPPARIPDRSVYTGVDGEPTIDFLPGEVLLPEDPEQRTVDALLCLGCLRSNFPTTARCRGCSTLLDDDNSEHRLIAQPTLGVIHLSGGGTEPLDADLVVGRNPAGEPLGPHQRAVIHGVGDRSVSRRHIELRLEGWSVMAVNLSKGQNTTVESKRGGHTPLVVGVPRKLEVGDTVQYGGSWLRYADGL